jgi:hypothetical protein
MAVDTMRFPAISLQQLHITAGTATHSNTLSLACPASSSRFGSVHRRTCAWAAGTGTKTPIRHQAPGKATGMAAGTSAKAKKQGSPFP